MRELEPSDSSATEQGPRCPEITLLFVGGTARDAAVRGVAMVEKKLDPVEFQRALSDLRDGVEVKLSGWDDTVDSLVMTAAPSLRPEGPLGDLAKELGFGQREVRFGDFVFELPALLQEPVPDLDRLIQVTNSPNDLLAPLREHGVHMKGRLLTGPEDPILRYRACLDLAAAFEGQGLLGMIRDESCMCLTLDQIKSFAEITKDPRCDELAGFELMVNRIPLQSREVDYWVTRGNALWGLPEFVVPLRSGAAAESAVNFMRANFLYSREHGQVVEPPEVIDTPAGRFQAHPMSVLGEYESHLDDGTRSVVYVSEDVAPLLGLEGRVESATMSMAQALVAAFVLVGIADGEIDKKEHQAFLASARNHLGVHEDFAPVLHLLAKSFVEILRGIIDKGISPIEHIDNFVRVAAAELEPAAELRARKAVYFLAHDIAAASGGLMGLTSKISRVEEKALDVLARALDLE
jgi:tellurite resistance protein